MKKTAIVIPVYKHLNLLTSCVNSIKENTDMTDVSIIVVANGCEQDIKEYLSINPDLQYIWVNEAIGFSRAINLGIEKALDMDYEIIVLMNDDVQVLKYWEKHRWITELVAPLEDPTIAISGPKILNDSVTHRDFLIFFLVAIRRDILEKFGLLDEIFNEGYGEDKDFCFKVVDGGYKLKEVGIYYDASRYAGDFPIYHLSEGTVHAELSNWDEIKERNQQIIRERYVDYTERLKSHAQLYDTLIVKNEYAVIPEEIKGTTVIDVGANVGVFTALALKHGAKKVIGAEPIKSICHEYLDMFHEDSRVAVFNKAVWGTSGNTLHFKVGEMDSTVSEETTGETVTTITIEDMLRYVPDWDNNLVLKMDCEGSEYTILQSLKRDLFRRFKYIHIEIHNFPAHTLIQGTSTIDDLRHLIMNQGFKEVNIMEYWGWRIGPNGEHLEEGKMPLLVNKYERIEEPVKKGPKYSIVIPTFNKCNELLKPCIESVKAATDLTEAEVIVVANGCFDNTREYVESLGEPFKLIWSDEQLGFTKATNLGLKTAQGEYVVLLNNDVIIYNRPEPNYWLKLMREPFEKYDRVGMTGPMKFIGVPNISNDFIMFFAAMTKKTILEEVGYLDESFTPGGVEDVDFGYRLTQANYAMIEVPEGIINNPPNAGGLSATEFPIYHPGGTTCRQEGNWDKVLRRNNRLLIQKFPDKFTGIDWLRRDITYKVFDCFPFFNELELLEIRLDELYDIVDKFVITESRLTHSGHPKPLYLSENLSRFEKYKDKIHIHIVDLPADASDPWVRERAQRESAREALRQLGAKDEDYIIVGDADEIPRAEAVSQYIQANDDRVGMLKLDRYMFYLNYRNVTTDEPQCNSKILKYKLLKPTDLCTVRYCDKYNSMPYYTIEDAGWHFTFMGGVDRVIEKVQSFAHQEYNTPEKIDRTRIMKLVDEGRDIYSANTTWEVVPLDKSYPIKVYWHDQEKYKQMGWVKDLPPKSVWNDGMDQQLQPLADHLPDGWFDIHDIKAYQDAVSKVPDCGTIVELGTWMGRSICSIAELIRSKSLKVISVDTFKGTQSTEAEKIIQGIAKYTDIRKIFEKNLRTFGIFDNVSVYQMTTDEAALLFQDKTVDLVFIDADHIHPAIDSDIINWYPKVKAGGMFGGHDYPAADVQEAVIANVEETINTHGHSWWSTKKTVYDTFSFFNEFDILDIRLHELDSVVDKFVLAESTFTHAGKPKPLYFEENKERYAPFLSKIVSITWGDTYGTPWDREFAQRDQARRALVNCTPDDIIIISDVDEIPSKESILRYRIKNGIMALSQKMCYYYLNCSHNEPWNMGKVMPYSMLTETLSNFRWFNKKSYPLLENAGWHFSYMGGVKRVKEKIESFSHQEFNSSEYTAEEILAKRIENGEDIFGRGNNKCRFICCRDG